MEALTLRPELDRLRGSEPGCGCDDELGLDPVCHSGSPLWTIYDKAS
jgi:hypothetical protein